MSVWNGSCMHQGDDAREPKDPRVQHDREVSPALFYTTCRPCLCLPAHLSVFSTKATGLSMQGLGCSCLVLCPEDCTTRLCLLLPPSKARLRALRVDLWIFFLLVSCSGGPQACLSCRCAGMSGRSESLLGLAETKGLCILGFQRGQAVALPSKEVIPVYIPTMRTFASSPSLSLQ